MASHQANVLHDPMPAFRQLTVPTLAMWGEGDNNVIADKDKPGVGRDLKAARDRDYSLVVIPKANPRMLEAKVGATQRSSRSGTNSCQRNSRRSNIGFAKLPGFAKRH